MTDFWSYGIIDIELLYETQNLLGVTNRNTLMPDCDVPIQRVCNNTCITWVGSHNVINQTNLQHLSGTHKFARFSYCTELNKPNMTASPGVETVNLWESPKCVVSCLHVTRYKTIWILTFIKARSFVMQLPSHGHRNGCRAICRSNQRQIRALFVAGLQQMFFGDQKKKHFPFPG